MDEQVLKYFLLFILVISIIMIPCLILIIGGHATLSIAGFAVDESGRLYVGTASEIQIYENNELVGTLSPKTSRSYAFTIKDNKLLLSTASQVYLMDLDGNVLETKEDLGASTFNQLQRQRKRFVSDNDTYRLKNTWGRAKIVKNDSEIVYQISIASVIVKALLVIFAIAMVSFPAQIMYKSLSTQNGSSYFCKKWYG